MTATSVPARRQRGAALLLILLAIMVAATTVLVARLDTTLYEARRLTTTQQALAAARSALIDYAAMRPDRSPGSPVVLPCPDIDDSLGLDEGVAHASDCGAAGETVMGRVPWKTLGIAAPKDSESACLWYVVSGSWKEAGAATAPLINSDSNGQLQLWGIDAAAVIEGGLPADRPVAMLIAPMAPLAGQRRLARGARQCDPGFAASDYLDIDAASGVSNASLSGTPDTLDILAVASERDDAHNDRIVTISRDDLARAISGRSGFDPSMRALGRALAECVADYARQNSGGTNDRRLPWPAPLDLLDYRPDAAYDDTDTALSGRLPDIVDHSNAQTGNPTALVLGNCDPASVPAWNATMQAAWRHWKDHFFYVVAESHAPDAATPSSCSNCLTVNGGGEYVAVVIYANLRLPALAQLRDAPPVDTDTRADPGNYLESMSAAVFPYTGGGLDLASQPSGVDFNDTLFCIDAALTVSEC